MKPFDEYLEEKKKLDEGIIRSGSVATFAARSATAGKKAENAYKRGLSVMNAATNEEDVHAKLDRINAALKAILDGLLYQQQQISNHVALDTVGHLASSKNRSRR